MKNVTGKIGVDGNEINESGTPKVAGFSFVRTPSPNPGVDSTPLMTWGEIEGTNIYISGVESRNSERTFNCALGFADKMFFQEPYINS